MAASAISSVLTKLAEPIFEEAVLLYRVSDDVNWLASEMRWMQSFLKDAEIKRRSDRSHLVNNWVRDVRDVAQEAEDIIDTFMLTIDPWQRRQRRIGGLMGRILRYVCLPFELGGLMGHIVRYVCLPFELKARHEVGAGIQKLRAKIQRIKASKDTYGLVNLGQTSVERPINDDLHKRRRIAPHLPNDNITLIGFDAHKKTIIGQLLDADIKQRCVVSIVGAGGIGKTTLATKIYNNSQIENGFSVHACVSVSQTFQYDDMVRKIAKDILGVNQLQSIEMDDVERKVYKFLNDERYLIILDDVWSVNVWDLMRNVLPDAKNGSRVLVTTRSMEVATSASTCIKPYEIPLLDNKQSWDLFLNNAFPQNEDANPLSCPQALKEVGGKLVKKCGGLPLALVALGGLVSRKDPTHAEWARVADRMDWTSTTEVGQNCINILALSYDDLPHHHLKSCFLYMVAIYPEDWEIRESQVVNLWVAEGLIPEARTRTMEETARSYLNELVARSMIQPHYNDPFNNVQWELHPIYRVHDLFRDFCIKEASDEGFLGVYCPNSPHGGINPCRRLALHGLSTNQVNNWLPAPNLRSLLNFRTYFDNHEILNGLKLLRVAHLEYILYPIFVEQFLEISSIHLRYLCVAGGFKNLRDCFSLYNLQTLDISNAQLKRLPGSIGKMQMLRHLYLPYNCECPPDICNLKNLMTLHGAGAGGGWIEHGSEKLVNMEQLAVYEMDARQVEVLLHSVGEMKRLTYLMLHFSEISTADSFMCFSKLDQLVWMGLTGLMFSVVRHLVFPPNLTILRLQHSRMYQDPMSVLEKLPNLTILRLEKKAFLGTVMICTTGGFPSLQQLVVERLSELEDWRVECGAMPKLNFLIINRCERLAMLPEGLQHLTFLKRLEVHDNRKDFRQRLEQEVGDDWYKIREVPNIFIHEL